jgi:phospholipase C
MALTRRALLVGGLGGAAVACTPSRPAPPLRRPDSLPTQARGPGDPDPSIPIEHVVVVMMENHSFDSYLGMLARRGAPHADGFRFDRAGRPLNDNPDAAGRGVRAHHLPTQCQPVDQPSQGWNLTRAQIGSGRMDGFVRASGDIAMGYWDRDDIPFYYSLASTFALANRWFASAPCPTFPNRRFLHAATSWGLTRSEPPQQRDAPPPNGTIFDRLNAHGISWTNYFSDIPQTALIPSVIRDNQQHLAPIGQFWRDCASGRLPAYSLVDPAFGLAEVIAGVLAGRRGGLGARVNGDDEENPQNIRYGERFVAQVVHAVMASPAWPKTMLVWLYDEHGGYYDHVAPPRAVVPDGVPPQLRPGDVPGRFDRYGVRVPAVVVSPWARPAFASNLVHDHTSVLAFVERKWNLPALTRRDANAAPMLDLLDFRRPALLEPPDLVAAPDPVGGRRCQG